MNFLTRSLAATIGLAVLAGCGKATQQTSAPNAPQPSAAPTSSASTAPTNQQAANGQQPSPLPTTVDGVGTGSPVVGAGNAAVGPQGTLDTIKLARSPNQHFAMFYAGEESVANGEVTLNKLFNGFNSVATPDFKTAIFLSGNITGPHTVKQRILDASGNPVVEGEPQVLTIDGSNEGVVVQLWKAFNFPGEGLYKLQVLLDGNESLSIPFDVGATAAAKDTQNFILFMKDKTETDKFPNIVGRFTSVASGGTFPFKATLKMMVGLGFGDDAKHKSSITFTDITGKPISNTKSAAELSGRIRDVVTWEVTFPAAGTYFARLSIDGQQTLDVPLVIQ